jgi:Kef-type K+ transport system membrane component KefB
MHLLRGTRRALAVALVWALAPALAHAATGHGPDVRPVLLALVVVLVGAKLGGALFEFLRMPSVLGELMVGVVIGNLRLFGVHLLDGIADDPTLRVIAELGVLFLLFDVGLESDLASMVKVGASSLLVALLGVVAPMLLGYFVTRWFFPTQAGLADWFVGATLCATSVGITARVLHDLGRTQSRVGRIILGAAVIDDVLGLIVLAVVVGVIEAADRGRAFDAVSVVWILGKALLFLGLAVVVGRWLSGRVFALAARLRGQGLLLTGAVALCFTFAWLAGAAGLAPIVGAFAAGLVLEDVHVRELVRREPHQLDVRTLLHPLTTVMVPVFFVIMGMGVDLSVFGHAEVLAFAGVLTAAALIGKQACSLGVVDRGVDRLAVGLGMIPRGEVGLIFASIGITLHLQGERVIDDRVYSAVVMMVAITTLLTPPLLMWRLRRSPAPADEMGA